MNFPDGYADTADTATRDTRLLTMLSKTPKMDEHGWMTAARTKRGRNATNKSPAAFNLMPLAEQHRKTRIILKKEPEVLYYKTQPATMETCGNIALDAAVQFHFAPFEMMVIVADYTLRKALADPNPSVLALMDGDGSDLYIPGTGRFHEIALQAYCHEFLGIDSVEGVKLDDEQAFKKAVVKNFNVIAHLARKSEGDEDVDNIDGHWVCSMRPARDPRSQLPPPSPLARGMYSRPTQHTLTPACSCNAVALINDGRAWDMDGVTMYRLPQMLTITEDPQDVETCAHDAWLHYKELCEQHDIKSMFSISVRCQRTPES